MADHGPGLPKNVRKAVTKVTEKLFVDQHSHLHHHRTKDVRRGAYLAYSQYINNYFTELTGVFCSRKLAASC